MNIVTLAEAKNRLSIDFNTKDDEITLLVNYIESYLSNATGIKFGDYAYIPTDDNSVKNLAKEYVLLRLYLDYYNAHTEIDDTRLTGIINMLKVMAHIV